MINRKLIITGVIIAAVFLVLINTITTVPTGFVGVKTRFGQVQEQMIQEGLNVKVPFIEKIVKIDCRTQRYSVTTEASSKDLQKVSNIKIVVNFNVNKSKANTLYKEVGTKYQEVLIEPSIYEAIKQGMSQYTAEELITKRGEVSNIILKLLQTKLEDRGILITALNITDLSFSEEFDKAVEQKQVVEQETQKAKYELEKARVENEKKIENAKADAEVMREQNSQITENTLKLKELEIQKEAIEKWNGQLPTTSLTDSVPFLNIGK
ncbi:SPFH domain / Band 7 family protein [compost metagenome]